MPYVASAIATEPAAAQREAKYNLSEKQRYSYPLPTDTMQYAADTATWSVFDVV